MKILVVHNAYGAPSGEETELDRAIAALRRRGHEVVAYTRSSEELAGRWFASVLAGASGIHSARAVREIRDLLRSERPDATVVQNLYPLISPAVLPAIAAAGVPIVMRVSNYKLVCPNGLLLSHGAICERCVGGREWWCILRNCEEAIGKSVAYAARTFAARVSGRFRDNIDVYLVASEFMRDKLVATGFDPDRIHVLPNVVFDGEPPTPGNGPGSYVAHVGRLSREKGIELLLAVAEANPTIPFRLAGNVNPAFRLPERLPGNVERVGFLSGEALSAFYRGARVVIATSRCYETFGMSVAEAMLHGRAVLAPRHGVFPELIEDGVTGALAEPNSTEGFSVSLRTLWESPELCRRLGDAARRRILATCSGTAFCTALESILAPMLAEPSRQGAR